MPSYDVHYLERKKLTMWVPATVETDAEKAQLAEHHIAMNTFRGTESKLLSIEPTPPEGWVPPDLTENVTPIK